MTSRRAQRRRTVATDVPGIGVQLTGHGFDQETPDHIIGRDALAGTDPTQHLWAVAAVWRIINPADCYDPDTEIHLDLESMLTISPPGCYRCEVLWAPGLENTACPGQPAS